MIRLCDRWYAVVCGKETATNGQATITRNQQQVFGKLGALPFTADALNNRNEAGLLQ
jgi:hypothetical protein